MVDGAAGWLRGGGAAARLMGANALGGGVQGAYIRWVTYIYIAEGPIRTYGTADMRASIRKGEQCSGRGRGVGGTDVVRRRLWGPKGP